MRTRATAVTRGGAATPPHFVYIVRCADGSLYTGYARDPRKRESVHNTGKGAKYTASRRPVVLVYIERRRTLSAALKRERKIKGWTRKEKLALVASAAASAGGTRRSTSRPRRSRSPRASR